MDKFIETQLKALKELEKSFDVEISHIEADIILCNILNYLGYDDVVKAFNKLSKWYC